MAAQLTSAALSHYGVPAWQKALATAAACVQGAELNRPAGRVVRATGLVIEATGLRLPVGSACVVEISPGSAETAEAEVVGFDGHTLYLMPQHDIAGLAPGARVFALEGPTLCPPPASDTPRGRTVPVGAGLLGRVLDGAGRPLDTLGELQ